MKLISNSRKYSLDNLLPKLVKISKKDLKDKALKECLVLLGKKKTHSEALEKVDKLKKNLAIYALQQALININYQDNRSFRGSDLLNEYTDQDFLEDLSEKLIALDKQAAVRALIHLLITRRFSITLDDNFGGLKNTQKWINLVMDVNDILNNLGKDAFEAIPTLLFILSEGRYDEYLCYLISRTLKKMGKIIEKPLIKYLQLNNNRSDNWRGISYAIWLLGKIEAENSAPIIINELNNPDYFVKTKATEALGILKSSEAVDDLCKIVLDKNLHNDSYESDLMMGGRFLLRNMSMYSSIMDDRAIRNQYGDFYIERNLREVAIEALGEIGDSKAIPILRKITNDKTEYDALVQLATKVIGKVDKSGSEVIPLIEKMLNDPDPQIKENAAQGLLDMGPEIFVPHLIDKYIMYNEHKGQKRAIDFVQKMTVDKINQGLIKALKDNKATTFVFRRNRRISRAILDYLEVLYDDKIYGLEKVTKKLIEKQYLEGISEYEPILIPDKYSDFFNMFENTYKNRQEILSRLKSFNDNDSVIAPKLLNLYQNSDYIGNIEIILTIAKKLVEFGEYVSIGSLTSKISIDHREREWGVYDMVDSIDRNTREINSVVNYLFDSYTEAMKKENAIELVAKLMNRGLETYIIMGFIDSLEEYAKTAIPFLTVIKDNPGDAFVDYDYYSGVGPDTFFPDLIAEKAEYLLRSLNPEYRERENEKESFFKLRDLDKERREKIDETLRFINVPRDVSIYDIVGYSFQGDGYDAQDYLNDKESSAKINATYWDDDDLKIIEEYIENNEWGYNVFHALNYRKEPLGRLVPVIINGVLFKSSGEYFYEGSLKEFFEATNSLETLKNHVHELLYLYRKTGEYYSKLSIVELLTTTNDVNALPFIIEILREGRMNDLAEENLNEIIKLLSDIGTKEIIPAAVNLIEKNPDKLTTLDAVLEKIDSDNKLRKKNLATILNAKEKLADSLISDIKENDSILIKWLAIELIRERKDDSAEVKSVLKELIKKSNHWELRQNAENTLVDLGYKGKIPEYTEPIDYLISKLKSPFSLIREESLNKIITLGSKGKKALPIIIEMIGFELNKEIREKAFEALFVFDENVKKALPKMIGIIKNENDIDMREYALATIEKIVDKEKISDKDLDSYISILKKCIDYAEGKESLEEEIIRTIGVLSSKKSDATAPKEMIIDLLNKMEIDRSEALQARSRMGDMIPITMYDGRSEPRRKEVVESLKKMKATKTVIEIIKETKNKKLKKHAIEALGMMQEEESLPILQELLENSDDVKVRLRAIDAIKNSQIETKQLVPFLIQRAFIESDRNVRFEIIITLQDLVKELNIGSLIQLLNKEQDYCIKCQIVNTLRKLENPKTELVFIKVLKEENDHKDAMKQLSRMQKLFSDPDYKVSEEPISFYALKALAEIKSEKAIPIIKNKLYYSKLPGLRSEAAKALGKIGSKEVIYDLFKAEKNDENDYVRRSALEALEMIAKKFGFKDIEKLRDIN